MGCGLPTGLTTATFECQRQRQTQLFLVQALLVRAFQLFESEQMSDSDISAHRADSYVNFDAPAVLRKWPSLNGQRRIDGTGPYFLLGSTLGDCIREFLAKPGPARHLYEIHTSPQPPLVGAVLSDDIVAELRHLREFL